MRMGDHRLPILVATLLFASLTLSEVWCDEDVIVREDMGVVFQRVTSVENFASSWSHTVVVKFPEVEELKVQTPFCQRNWRVEQQNFMSGLCEMYSPVFDTYNDIRNLLARGIDQKMVSMYSLLQPGRLDKFLGKGNLKGRVARSPFDFIGSISKSLFGTATSGDIEQLKKHILALEENPESFKGFKRFAAELSSLQVSSNKNFKMIQEGINSNRILINQTFQGLKDFKDSLTDVLDDVKAHIELLGQVMAIMHGINSREINTMLLITSELEKFISGCDVLLRGYVPVQIVPPQQLLEIIGNISDYLQQNQPNYQVVYKQPASYYQMPGIVTYTTTENHLFIKIKIPLSTSSVLFEVFRVRSVPVSLAKEKGDKPFTEVTGLPDYLGIGQDKKFFTELDQITFDNCKGVTLRRCEVSLNLHSRDEITCASAIYFKDKNGIQSKCKVALYPNISSTETHVIDLDHERVFISTNDFRWIKSCARQPPQVIQGCANCIVRRQCDCSIKGHSLYIAPSIQACSNNLTSTFELVPNYMAALTYLKVVDPKLLMDANSSFLRNVLSLRFELPDIKFSKSSWIKRTLTLQDQHLALDFQNTLSAVKENRTLFLDPLDAWLSELPEPLSPPGKLVNFYLIATAILALAVMSSLVLNLRLRGRLLTIERTFHRRIPEILALSTGIPRTAAQEGHLSDEGDEDMYIMGLLTICAIFLTLYQILKCTLYMLGRVSARNKNISKLLETQRTLVQIVITDLQQSLTKTILDIPSPITDILYSNPRPANHVIAGFPHLQIDWNSLILTSKITGQQISLPTEITLGIWDYYKYSKIKNNHPILSVILISPLKCVTVMREEINPLIEIDSTPQERVDPISDPVTDQQCEATM